MIFIYLIMLVVTASGDICDHKADLPAPCMGGFAELKVMDKGCCSEEVFNMGGYPTVTFEKVSKVSFRYFP